MTSVSRGEGAAARPRGEAEAAPPGSSQKHLQRVPEAAINQLGDEREIRAQEELLVPEPRRHERPGSKAKQLSEWQRPWRR